VAVLGGGDSALDCLRAAIRYGAREAVGIYRRDAADMPCSRRDYQSAIEEGARFIFCAAPAAVLGNDQRQVTGLRLLRTELGLPEDHGPRPFLVLPGTEFELEADWVVTALGFEPLACPHSDDFSELAVNEWGGLVVDKNQMTSLPGVFAGGDIVRGPTQVLDAVRDARKAAEQIHAYLSGKRQPAIS
jgi:glutamate synthase (NADPH/NADH) small chain